jgi:hypothetical protein
MNREQTIRRAEDAAFIAKARLKALPDCPDCGGAGYLDICYGGNPDKEGRELCACVNRTTCENCGEPCDTGIVWSPSGRSAYCSEACFESSADSLEAQS